MSIPTFPDDFISCLPNAVLMRPVTTNGGENYHLVDVRTFEEEAAALDLSRIPPNPETADDENTRREVTRTSTETYEDVAPDISTKLLGRGPEVLIQAFQFIERRIQSIGGFHALAELSIEEFDQIFTIDAEDPEVHRLIAELRVQRDPWTDIESIVKQLDTEINEQWVNSTPGEVFTWRFMHHRHMVPEYYQLYAQTRSPPAREVTAAWLTDLSHGIYITCRGMIEGVICISDDEDADEALAEFIMNSGLRDAFMAVPETMRYKAHVNGVANALARYA